MRKNSIGMWNCPVLAVGMPAATLDAPDLRDPVRVIGEDDFEPAEFCWGDLDWNEFQGSLLVPQRTKGLVFIALLIHG